MKTSLPKIDGIYDIQPPPAAELSNTEWFLMFFIFSIMLGLCFYFLWKTVFSKRNRIKRQILQLQKASAEDTTYPDNTVYLLSDLLRRGLGLTCLTQQTAIPDKLKTQQRRWTGFTNKLDRLRYKKINVTSEELDPLFTESLFWLRNWP